MGLADWNGLVGWLVGWLVVGGLVVNTYTIQLTPQHCHPHTSTDSLAYAQECIRLAPHCAEAYLRVGNCMRVMGDLPAAASAYEQALACSSHNGGEGAAAGGQQQHIYLDLYATLGVYMNCLAVSCAEPSFTGILNTSIHLHNSSFHFFAHPKLWQPRSIGRWGSTTRPSAATPRPSATAPATHPPGRGWRRWRRRRETLRWRWRATKKVSEPLCVF